MFANILLIFVGILLIAEALFLPKLINKSKNKERFSKLLGDRYTRVLYFIVGCMCVVWGALQIIY